MTPRRSLHPGDVVETSVDGIGTLKNSVLAVGAGADTKERA